MKKFFLVIVVMAFFTSQIDAQIKFGAKAGLNFDNAKLSKDLDRSMSTGWQAGLMEQIKIPIIGIAAQPEVLYTVKNTEVDGESNSVGYFEVPINFSWGPDLLLVRPFVMGGPYFGYVLNVSGEGLKDKVEKTADWGIGLGFGIDILKFQAAVRYAWGMKDVSGATDFELKNRTLSVSLGYFF